MIIRKLFKYEMSHRVVGAFTKRCSQNIHGHSYKMEYLFSGHNPDAAQMVMDFGFVKKYFHPFVDSFDHAHMHWIISDAVKEEKYIKDNNERYILAPFSSTAEMQAKMFATYGVFALEVLKRMKLVHNNVYLYSTIVHETDTGYAEYNILDFDRCNFPLVDLKKVVFSPGILADWSKEFKKFYKKIVDLQMLP